MYKNEKRYALVNGVLLDGTRDMAPQTGKVICVDGSRIAAVTDGAAPAGYETVDLGGQYVLPGLINLLVHLPASGKPKEALRPQKAGEAHHLQRPDAPRGHPPVRGLRQDGAAQRRHHHPHGGRRGGF